MEYFNVNKNDKSFEILQKVIQRSIILQVELNDFWEINKVPFEDQWEADQLVASVQEIYHLKLSDESIDTDFAEDDDPESLTNCYLTFVAINELAEVLEQHNCSKQFVVDIFNSAIGHSISILSEKDVENDVSLMILQCNDQNSLSALHESLKNFLSKLPN